MKWRSEIEAKKRVARDAKLDAARAAKFTLEVERTLAEVSWARIKRVCGTQRSSPGRKGYSSQGRTVLYV